MTRDLRTEFTPPTDAGRGWEARLQDGISLNGNNVVFESFSGYRKRLNRVAYPEEILIGRTVEEQGDSVGRWVVETFNALVEAGPPPRLTASA